MEVTFRSTHHTFEIQIFNSLKIVIIITIFSALYVANFFLTSRQYQYKIKQEKLIKEDYDINLSQIQYTWEWMIQSGQNMVADNRVCQFEEISFK